MPDNDNVQRLTAENQNLTAELQRLRLDLQNAQGGDLQARWRAMGGQGIAMRLTDGTHPSNERLSEELISVRDYKIREANLMKMAPVYDHGTLTWAEHVMLFDSMLHTSPVMDSHAKRVLYSKMTAKSFRMIMKEMSPELPQYSVLTFKDYEKLLSEIFSPQLEADTAYNEFKERKQLPHEHVTAYMHDKRRLFKVAYPEGERSSRTLYESMTDGLLNAGIRGKMRKFQVSDSASQDFLSYQKTVLHYAAYKRTAYGKGEVAYSAIVGLDTFQDIRHKNLAVEKKPSRVKSEVNAVGHDVKATSSKKGSSSKECWTCGSTTHFQASCPKQGYERTVQAVQKDEEFDSSDGEIEKSHDDTDTEQEIAHVKHKRHFRHKKNFSKHKPKTNPKFRKRVGYVEQDEDGKLVFFEDNMSENEAEKDTSDSVHFLA